MARKIFIGILFLLFLRASSGLASEPDVPNINVDNMIDWIPEEVPRTVSFYIDTDNDGIFDIIVAYSLIEAFPCNTNCVNQITDNGDHWILPAPGINYYVIKEWIFWRYRDEKDWRGVDTTSDWIFKYPLYEDWYNEKFLKLWPEMAP